MSLHPLCCRILLYSRGYSLSTLFHHVVISTQQLSAGSGSLSACLPACLQLAVLLMHTLKCSSSRQQIVPICQWLRLFLSSAAVRSKCESSVDFCYQTCNSRDAPGSSGGKLEMFRGPLHSPFGHVEADKDTSKSQTGSLEHFGKTFFIPSNC